MSTNLLNFNKPCNACRRRKVRCDKGNPCNNCVRHGVLCAYDGARETLPVTPESQQMLHDRVERLESLIQELSLASVAASNGASTTDALPRRSGSVSVESPLGSIHFRDISPLPGEHGTQVFEPNVSYYMGPNYWMNMHDFVFEPRCLLNNDLSTTGDSPLPVNQPPPGSWPLTRQPSPVPVTLAALHLSREKEDLLMDLYFKTVEPFVRTTHEGFCRREVLEFRAGVSKVHRDIEAWMFAMMNFTVAALPAEAVMGYFGETRQELMHRLNKAAELALERAEAMRSRKIIVFAALLNHVVRQIRI